MNEYTFRPARAEDLPAMMAVIRDAQAMIARLGIDQWQNGYPNGEALQKDMERNGAFVLETGGRVIGTLAYLPCPEPTYAVIRGAWLTGTNAPYGVIHRLAVHRDFRASGAGAAMLVGVEALARAAGQVSLRVDTHHGNLPMQRFLAKHGFVPCGDITLADGAPRIAYEKRLGPEG